MISFYVYTRKKKEKQKSKNSVKSIIYTYNKLSLVRFISPLSFHVQRTFYLIQNFLIKMKMPAYIYISQTFPSHVSVTWPPSLSNMGFPL